MNDAILTALGVFLISMIITSAVSWDDYRPSTAVSEPTPAQEVTTGTVESSDTPVFSLDAPPAPVHTDSVPVISPDVPVSEGRDDSLRAEPDSFHSPADIAAELEDNAGSETAVGSDALPQTDISPLSLESALSEDISDDVTDSDPGEVAVGLPLEESTGRASGIDETQQLSSTQRVGGAPSAVDSLRLLIPERTWADSNRVRRELTPEIAREYPREEFEPRKIENTEWGVGENLVFSVDYGFYQAGVATMSVVKEEMVNGAPCYHIQTTARSNDFISRFYEVSDEVNSYIDKEGIFSRRIEQLLREGNYKSDRYTDFYPERLIALNTEKKYGLTEIPLFIQDVLSSLYLVRTYDLEVGKDIYITTYADGKVYPLRIKVDKIETVEVPAGRFRCYVIEPLLQSDGIFRQKGSLRVWMTADEYKIPVKMTSKIIIGSIGTNLMTYTLGNTQ